MPATIFDQAIFDKIIERLEGGEPMAAICREPGMPAARTVREWNETVDGVPRNPKLSAALACARDDGRDWLAAECLLIADTPMEGVVEEYERKMFKKPDGTEYEKLVLIKRRKEDMLGHRKLKIDTRLKLLAIWDPKRFGQGVTLRGDKDNPIPVESTGRYELSREQLLAIAAGAAKKPEDPDS